MENRTIKFRGLQSDGKGWVIGALAHFFNNKENTMIMPNCYFGTKDFGDEDENENPIISDEIALGGFVKVIPETVGQFTGLKDKNGKECFEGDVLDNLEVVVFAQGAFMTSIGALAMSIEHREIIGNIHSNPELLK